MGFPEQHTSPSTRRSGKAAPVRLPAQHALAGRRVATAGYVRAPDPVSARTDTTDAGPPPTQEGHRWANQAGPMRTGARHRRGSPRRPSRLLRIWMTSTVALFALGALWSLATPVGAAPDEPTQIIKAAAVVSGQLVGAPTPGQPKAVITVTVPESFASDLHLATCYAFTDTRPAGCAPHLSGVSRPSIATTYVGRYPPLYYLLVGAPTLLSSTDTAVHLMRLLSVLWSALLIGLAFAAAAVWSRSRLLVIALAVCATPQVVFLASVVNPSGLEIAAAIATWTCGLVLVLDHRHAPPVGLVVACAASASVLALCRGLSPLWVALIAGTLVALTPGTLPTLWKSRQVRAAAAIVAAVGVVAVAFIVGAHTLTVLPAGRPIGTNTPELQVVADALGETGRFLRQVVGVFGWLDTPSPVGVLAGWWAAAGILVVVSLVSTDRRAAGTIAAVILVSVLLPAAIMVSHASKSGLVWQARDGLPLYAGIPLVAGAVAGRSSAGCTIRGLLHDRLVARLVILLACGIAAAQLVDFGWALRRYTVGLGATLNPFARVPGGWSPPVPAVVLVAAAVLVTAAYAWWVSRLSLLVISATSRAGVNGRHSTHPSGEPLLADLLHTVLAGTSAVRSTLTRHPVQPAARHAAGRGTGHTNGQAVADPSREQLQAAASPAPAPEAAPLV